MEQQIIWTDLSYSEWWYETLTGKRRVAQIRNEIVFCRGIVLFFDYTRSLFDEKEKIGVWKVPSQYTSSIFLIIFHESTNIKQITTLKENYIPVFTITKAAARQQNYQSVWSGEDSWTRKKVKVLAKHKTLYWRLRLFSTCYMQYTFSTLIDRY